MTLAEVTVTTQATSCIAFKLRGCLATVASSLSVVYLLRAAEGDLRVETFGKFVLCILSLVYPGFHPRAQVLCFH